MDRTNKRSTSRKALMTLAALLIAAGIAGVGTFATFTGTANQSHSVTSGTVTIAFGATGSAANRLNVNATAVAAGDTIQRSFDLSNTGSLDLASVSLTSTATVSSTLDTDTTNGLQMVIDQCSVAWTESGSSPAFTYACTGGTLTTIVTSQPVVESNLSMSGLNVMTAGGTDHLRLTLTLPSAAGATLQGKSSTIQYAFTATQRNATSR